MKFWVFLVILTTFNAVVSSTQHSNQDTTSTLDERQTAPTNVTIYISTTYEGLYFSTDHGRTWTKTHPDRFNGEGIPVSGHRIYMTGERNYSDNSRPFYISQDGGRTWITKKIQSAGNCRRGAATSQHLFVINGYHIDRLENDLSFKNVLNITQTNHSYTNIYISGHIVYVIAVYNEATILYISGDQGETWDMKHFDFVFYCYLSIEGNKIYVSNSLDGTIRASTDGGNSWRLITKEQLGYSNECHIKTIVSKGNNVIVGTNLGLAISNDNGVTWRKALEGEHIRLSFLTPRGNLYCTVNSDYIQAKGIIYFSDNFGHNFTEILIKDTAKEDAKTYTMFIFVQED